MVVIHLRNDHKFLYRWTFSMMSYCAETVKYIKFSQDRRVCSQAGGGVCSSEVLTAALSPFCSLWTRAAAHEQPANEVTYFLNSEI